MRRDNVRAELRCGDCRRPLAWERFDRLVCTNTQCAAVGMTLSVWQAQRERERRGLDVPAPGPGWPRPVVDGAPHPWITPVSDGRPWWRVTHGERVLQAQNDWLCQVCGQQLEQLAWVVLDGDRVVSDTALHRRCLTLATSVCPHLTAAQYRLAEVSREDILGDGQPLPARRAAWRERWTVRPVIAALAS